MRQSADSVDDPLTLSLSCDCYLSWARSHPEFGSYNKCNFRLRFQTSPILQKSGIKKHRIAEITPETPVRTAWLHALTVLIRKLTCA